MEGKYKEWQKKLHPDLVHSKSQVCLLRGYPFFFLFHALDVFVIYLFTLFVSKIWGKEGSKVECVDVFSERLTKFVCLLQLVRKKEIMLLNNLQE